MVGLMRSPFGFRHLEDPRLLRLHQLCDVAPPDRQRRTRSSARWITIPPPGDPLARGALDHESAARWITSRAPLKALLEAALPNVVARRVEARLAKDLTKSNEHELPGRIAEELTS